MKLLVGIDVSSEKLDTCFLDSEDQILLEESLSNTISGASKIKEYILQFNDSNLYNRIIIGMEATSVYSFHPSTFLAEDRELKALNVEVVVMNPKAIHRFKGIFDEDKTDRIDAYRIADFLRFDRFVRDAEFHSRTYRGFKGWRKIQSQKGFSRVFRVCDRGDRDSVHSGRRAAYRAGWELYGLITITHNAFRAGVFEEHYP